MPFWMIQRMLVGRGYWEEAGGEDKLGGGEDNPSNTEQKKDNGPSESEAKLVKEVMAKKAKIKELDQALAEAKEAIKRFDGIDPEQVAALLKEREDAEKSKLEAKGEWEKLKERMASEHAKEAKRLADEAADLKAKLNASASVIHRLTVGHSFDTSKFITEDTVYTPRKASVIYGQHFEVDESGRVVGYDKPSGYSDRTPLVDSQGKPLPFEEAIKQLVEADPDRDDILRSKRKQGAGSGSESVKPVTQQKKLSALDKIALGLSGSK